MRLVLLAALAALLITACSPKAETVLAEEPLPLEASSILEEPAPQPALDPTALDLSKIALAMRIPTAFRAYDDGARLRIGVTNARLGVNISEVFALSPVDGVESAFLAGEGKDGFTMLTYATQAADAERLTALSLELVRLKTEAPGENELTFVADAPGCWNGAADIPTSLPRTLYIRVVPEQDFMILVPEQELGEGDVPGIEGILTACTE